MLKVQYTYRGILDNTSCEGLMVEDRISRLNFLIINSIADPGGPAMCVKDCDQRLLVIFVGVVDDNRRNKGSSIYVSSRQSR